MKHFILSICLLFSATLLAQENTEVYLFDLSKEANSITIKYQKNLSKNDGYDNQPSFYNDRYILFASSRNEQTDIAKYDQRYNSKTWLNYTTGGEYSPQPIPESDAVSAVRLDKDGKQRLYRYSWSNGESQELIKDLVVAYYTWFDKNTIVSAVIEGDNLNLYVTNLLDGKSRKYATNVGRSFHKIPGTNLISYISKTNDKEWEIRSLNPKNGVTKLVAYTIKDVEDICWADNRTLISGNGSDLYKLTLKKDLKWKKIANLSEYGINAITRLNLDSSKTKLLLVGNTSKGIETSENDEIEEIEPEDPELIVEFETIVQKQLDAYNAKDVETFMAQFSDDIQLYNYPNELLSQGKTQMRKDYLAWFNRTPDLKAKVTDRIVIGNKVIDKEHVTANGKLFKTVAIYEITNGLISKVTFMQ